MSLNIYYLDDEPELGEIFADSFSSENVIITTFTDPETAIAKTKKTPPDLLFLDYRLPNTSGVIIARGLSLSIDKVLVTGDIDVKHHDLFKAVFAKPFEMDAIQAFIRSYQIASKVA